jgi:hypothetical protein
VIVKKIAMWCHSIYCEKYSLLSTTSSTAKITVFWVLLDEVRNIVFWAFLDEM